MGSGGVLLPNYSSLKIAENYQLLEALFPGRIDLGFGRAPGDDRRTSKVLNDEKNESIPYGRKVADLLGFVTGRHMPGSTYEGMRVDPETRDKAQPFVLGASGATAEIAAQAGLGFTFAHFMTHAVTAHKRPRLTVQRLGQVSFLKHRRLLRSMANFSGGRYGATPSHPIRDSGHRY